jgi:uncharacterized protein YbbC (DUF1343 family)
VTRVRPGLEELLSRPGVLRGARLGLVAHAASVDRELRHAARLLHDARGWRLSCLFGPEHGLHGGAQDLVEVGHSRDRATGLPVFSLYGPTRRPSARMLREVDVVVVDLQDVGARYYTFVYTLLLVMEACAALGRRLVVLDRPNPIGALQVDGNVLDPAWRSFVGLHPLAVRHAMTVGELALMFRAERGLVLDLHVVPMRGYRRAMSFEDTGLPWVMPSPNMPSLETAWVYPGGCLVEGTNLSEGRGTTRPFELVGAPWLDGQRLAAALEAERLPGLAFRACRFVPTFHKHAGRSCEGVQVHVTDRRRARAFVSYLVLLHHARRQDRERFAWRQPPYEYETEKLPIDILCGGDRERRALEAGLDPRRLVASWRRQRLGFLRRRSEFLLYPE